MDFCPNCKTFVNRNTRTCPECGHQIGFSDSLSSVPKVRITKSTIRIIIAIGIIIPILGGAYFTGILNYNTINSISSINKIVNDTLGKTNNIIPNNSQNPQTNSKTISYDYSVWPCSLNSDNLGNINVNCATNGVYHFNNPSITNLNISEVRLAWNAEGNYQALDQKSFNEKEYDLGSLVSKEITNNQSPTVNTQPSNPVPQVTFPKITLPKVTIPSITIPGTSNIQAPTLPTDLPSLYAYALKVVNDDRKAKGLNPVALSNIHSAQNHADDQMSLKYFSHWNSDGVKPYVVYTKLGGRGSVAENDYYTYSYCPTSNCYENTYDPYAEIKKGEDEMLNNDAASNWGHRDNILDPHHTHVNFGIAYDHERFYFVQNFEDNLVNWQTVKLTGNTLMLSGTILPGYTMDSIDVFSDPSPKTLTQNDLDNSPPYNAGYYDQGTDAGMIVPKPTGNSYYPECSPGKITARFSDGKSECLDYSMYVNNSANPNIINTAIDVSKWTNSVGLHTIYLNLKDSSEKTVSSTSLTLEYLK